MSRHYKPVRNGNGTEITISENNYISIGPNGTDIMLRCGDEVLAFDSFADKVSSMDKEKCSYYKNDNDIMEER